MGGGLLFITSILDPDKLLFGFEDFAFVENLYSFQEVANWLHDTMLLEVDTMSVADVETHVNNVKDIVAG